LRNCLPKWLDGLPDIKISLPLAEPRDDTEEDSTVDAEVTPFTRLSVSAARMLAVETLLADPESLQDDVLESCLYLLRERLRGD
jgi:hypothetical protein